MCAIRLFNCASRAGVAGVSASIVVFTASMLVAANTQESRQVTSEADDFLARSSFVFEGTVRKVKASTVKRIPSGDSTAVVLVDRVVKGAETVGDFTGEEVTVVLVKPLSLELDGRFTFFTNPKVSSKSLAVEEVGHTGLVAEIAKEKGAPDLKARAAKADQEIEGKKLQAAVAQADLIVAGQVTATKPMAVDGARPPFSEHDPEWWEATIQIQGVEKGQAGATVTAYYPHSRDIRWFAVPKLDELKSKDRVFIFHAKMDPHIEGAGEEREQEPDQFEIKGLKILHPEDVQPAEKRDQVRAMLKR